jgi:ATP-dependent DNA helicase RecG
MTVYGDLDTTVLDEMPPGRTPITTAWARGPIEESAAWAKVRSEVGAGRQAYVVCPLVEDSEKVQAKSATEEYLRLQSAGGELQGLRLGLLHGQMPAAEKEAVMASFRAGELDVLVATTVIEVGVDVPNATVMVVLDADRFGVSQLHQLRGRVGRGGHAGLCLLVTDMPADSPARERVDGVADTLDGFELARLDLAQRREGDVLGAAQSGRRSSLRLLRLLQDEPIIAAARDEATRLVDEDPTLSRHDALVAAVRELLDSERADYLEKA